MIRDPSQELRAALESSVLVERSDLGRILATGPDFLDLLQRLGTNDVRGLEPGRGMPTVLTSPKGRIVHRLFVFHAGERGILVITGPGRAPEVSRHIDRYTFAERTGLADFTGGLAQFALVGPSARAAVAETGIPVPEPYETRTGAVAGHEVRILGHDGMSRDGLSVLVSSDASRVVWKLLERSVKESGGRVSGGVALEAWRVLRGLAVEDHELTEDHNPLEAGLWEAVSFDKGCYVGQEVVARLNTYDRVARRLVGLRFAEGAEPPEQGAPLFRETRAVGKITTALIPPGHHAAVGLAYVKREFADPGVEVRVDDADASAVATVTPTPFPTAAP